MISTGFKLYFGIAMVALFAAFLYGYTTGGDNLGPVTLGFKGPVGEHVGYSVLVMLSVLTGSLGGLLVAFRDGDAEAAAQLLGADAAPAGQRPVSGGLWPLLAAFGVGLTVIGLVVSAQVFVAGIAVVAVVAVEWTISAWADRATGDPEANKGVRDELMRGFEVPALAVLGFGGTVALLSRVLLAVPKLGATLVAIGVGLLIFVGGIILAMRPKVSKNFTAALVLIGVVGLLSAGIVSAANGERDFERHEVEHTEAEPGEAGDTEAEPGAGAEEVVDEGAEG